ncbi:MAG: hypothetical protein Q7R73_04480 [bacterium]|nr:hypothetical protein [bacterium]
MGILLGSFDPLKLVFNVLNALMTRGLISYDEARKILKDSLDPNMSEIEKEKFLDSIIVKSHESKKS